MYEKTIGTQVTQYANIRLQILLYEDKLRRWLTKQHLAEQKPLKTSSAMKQTFPGGSSD
jgi:hypothetical protein